MKNLIKGVLCVLAISFLSCATIGTNSDHQNSLDIPEHINEYGGITIETINENHLENNLWVRIRDYYDFESNLVKRVIIPTEFITDARGILQQIEHFDGAGNIIRYEILFSEEFKQRHDHNRVVEIVGTINNNRIIAQTFWYRNARLIDFMDFPRNMHAFPFFNIQYIENALIMAHEPNPLGDSIVFSTRYHSIRSFVRFDTELFELDDINNNILRNFAFAPVVNIPEGFLSLFRKKVRVFYGDRYYWFFVHSGHESLVYGQYATIGFIPQLWNGELFLLGLEFFNPN